MIIHDFILTIVALISEVLGTISGFGSSTFFVPVATFFESFILVLVLTAILHSFSNIFKMTLFFNFLNKELFLRFALPSLIFCVIGALLTKFISIHKLEVALGIFLIIFSIGKLTSKNFHKIPNLLITPLSIISGFLTGLIGTGGAVRGMALASLNISKEQFVAISAAIDLGGDLLRVIIYLINGYMDWNQWFYIPMFAIAAYLGARVGKKILNKIKQEQFEKIVSIFILFSGLLLIFK